MNLKKDHLGKRPSSRYVMDVQEWLGSESSLVLGRGEQKRNGYLPSSKEGE